MNASTCPASDFASRDPIGPGGWILAGIIIILSFTMSYIESFIFQAIGYKTCIRNALRDPERDKLAWLFQEQEKMNRGWRIGIGNIEIIGAEEVLVEEEAPQIERPEDALKWEIFTIVNRVMWRLEHKISTTDSARALAGTLGVMDDCLLDDPVYRHIREKCRISGTRLEDSREHFQWHIFTIVNKVMWRLEQEIPATDSARAFETEIGVLDDSLLDDPAFRYIREKCQMSGTRLEDSREDFRWEYARLKEMDRETLREEVFYHVREEITKREDVSQKYYVRKESRW